MQSSSHLTLADVQIKFGLVLVAGSSISVVSIGQNAVLLWVLLSERQFRNSHLFYMIFLAASDILTAASYISLMSGQILMEWMESERLGRIWHSYLRQIFALSNVNLTFATYLITAATLERYLVVFGQLQSRRVQKRHRLIAIALAFLLGLIFRGERPLLSHPFTCPNRFCFPRILTLRASHLGEKTLSQSGILLYVRLQLPCVLCQGVLA